MCFCPANSFLPIVMVDENRYTAFVDTKLCCESWQQQTKSIDAVTSLDSALRTCFNWTSQGGNLGSLFLKICRALS